MDKVHYKLLNNALRAARELGLEAKVEPLPRADRKRADARLRLRFGGEEVLLAVEVKPGLRPATLGPVLMHLERLGEPVVLITDYVTPPLADRLREHGVQFLDAAGNAYLNCPPLLVWVKGQRPAQKPAFARPAGRAFQAAGLQVVFALLGQPRLVDRPYREIARLAGVAHGTVGLVMVDLMEQGFVIDLGETGRRLRNRRRLLDIWVEAYARTLRPKLLLGRYCAPTHDWWQRADVLEYGAQWGAEPAAARLTQYLRPGVATLYAETVPARLLADQRLRNDADGDVEIRKRFWAFEQEWGHPELTPPLLIYADLLATGEARCMEAGKRVYEEHLAGFIEQE